VKVCHWNRKTNGQKSFLEDGESPRAHCRARRDRPQMNYLNTAMC